MDIGKLEWDDLKTIIDENKSVKREDVRIRSGIGEDCSVINFGDYECVVSTDPITGAAANIGKLSVHINANDIASCGVEVVGILVTILAPPASTLEEIKAIMKEIDEETKKLNIEILGGHTEVTDAVNRVVVSCTAIGKGKKGEAVATSEAKIGDDIIVTKNLCLEGTSIIVNDYLELCENIISKEEIDEAREYSRLLSVVPEGRLASKFGVNSMHDITEGGILGAIWEVSKACGLGFELYKGKLPISEVTKKICSKLKLDPLRFISSGSLLITCKEGEKMVKYLEKSGIKSTIVGKITEEGSYLIDNNNRKVVEPPKRDELFKL